MEKRFSELRSGDHFRTDFVEGVCVLEPKEVRVEKFGTWPFRKKVRILHAVCIELHPYLGSVEWNPQYREDRMVTWLNSDREY